MELYKFSKLCISERSQTKKLDSIFNEKIANDHKMQNLSYKEVITEKERLKNELSKAMNDID